MSVVALFNALQFLDHLIHALHGDDLHTLHLDGAFFHVAVGNDGAGKAQASGLTHPHLGVGHGAALACQPQLTDDNEIVGYHTVGQGGHQGGGDGQIRRRLSDGQTADNVHVDVVLVEFQPQPLFQHRQNEAHAVVFHAVARPTGGGEDRGGDECLDLSDQGTGALNGTQGAVARHVLGTSREQHFRGVGHLLQAFVGHLEYADLVGGTVAILHRADDAVGLLALALEVEHRVHHVLQHLGACDTALLVDVTHQKHGNTLALGLIDKGQRTFPYLSNTAGGGVDLVGVDGLDGVQDHDVGPDLLGLLQNVLQIGLGQDVQMLSRHPQPLGAELELAAGFLARDVEHLAVLSQRIGDLHEQGGLADAGFTRQKHYRACHQTAAQHAIQLRKSRVGADVGGKGQLSELGGSVLTAQSRHGGALRGLGVLGGGVDDLLHKGIPFPAMGAFPQPLGGLGTAFAADVDGFEFHRDCPLPFGLIRLL